MATPTPSPSIVIFSGGSASNSLVDVFSSLSSKTNTPLTYLIGITDNGGSTSELLRMFGGPGIGDIRSRLVRLIPSPSTDSLQIPGTQTGHDVSGVGAFMNHRLDAQSTSAALEEFNSICHGAHQLWRPIPPEKRDFLRAIFVHLQAEILKRTRYPSAVFDFRNASVGNLFLTGARLFTGSFQSAIWLFRASVGLGERDAMVWPVIESRWSHHIAAGLEDGSVIVGQNQISHPSEDPAPPGAREGGGRGTGTGFNTPVNGGSARGGKSGWDEEEKLHDAQLPGSLHALNNSQLHFSKDATVDLPARIKRVWYINTFGDEILPRASAKAETAVRDAVAIIYSIGSLWTSLVPVLLPAPLPALLERQVVRGTTLQKIFLLNNSCDREVSGGEPYTAADFVQTVAKAMWFYTRSRTAESIPLSSSSSDSSVTEVAGGNEVVEDEFQPEIEVRKFVTHLVYLVGEGTPLVDVEMLGGWGVRCIRVQGRWEGKSGEGRLVYEERELSKVLAGIIEGKQ